MLNCFIMSPLARDFIYVYMSSIKYITACIMVHVHSHSLYGVVY